MRHTSLSAALAFALALAPAACSEAEDGDSVGTTAEGGRIELSVSPLTLAGVTDVVYTVTVANTATPPAQVWQRQIASSQFGDSQGGLTYIGTCDASTGTNTVSLHVDSLLGQNKGVLTDWVDPGTLTQTIPCTENADTPVRFDITIARRANQGFFDVAVEFDDIFCSAKLDCVDAFLHNGSQRDTTAIVAFACTTGEGSPTWLHFDTVELDCTDGKRYIDPTLGPGNTNQTSPHVFQVATYRNNEQLAPYDKCFWNTAIGIDLASFTDTENPVDCTLRARASASPTDWEDGRTPSDHVWPYIQWEKQIITANALSCTEHQLDQPGSGVETVYATPTDPQSFQSAMACQSCDDGACDVDLKGKLCTGTLDGVDGPVTFADTAGGVVVTVAGVASAPMPLPDDYALVGCCANPCCDAGSEGR